MPDRLRHPGQSKMNVFLLNRIATLDEPHLSMLAEAVGKNVSNIQKHMFTMVDDEWIIKEKKGRKAVYSLNPRGMWIESKYLDRLEPGAEWNELKEPVQHFLETALRTKLIQAVQRSDDPIPEQQSDIDFVEKEEKRGRQWVRGIDHTGLGSRVWFGTDISVNEILQSIADTVVVYEATARELGHDDVTLTESEHPDAAYVRSYAKLASGEWTDEDMDEFLEDTVETEGSREE